MTIQRLMSEEISMTTMWMRQTFLMHRVDNKCKFLYDLGSLMGSFIYILDSSNSSSFTFWTSQFTSSSRCNWTGISTGNSNGSWTDKHSSHFSKAKEMSVKATSFFMLKTTTNKFEMMLKCCWNDLKINRSAGFQNADLTKVVIKKWNW